MENAGEAYPRCPIPLLRFFAAKYVRFLCLEKLIHFMDRPYEAINGTVRPASVFLKEDCGLEFVVAEISYGEFIRKFIKKLFFSLVSTC